MTPYLSAVSASPLTSAYPLKWEKYGRPAGRPYLSLGEGQHIGLVDAPPRPTAHHLSQVNAQLSGQAAGYWSGSHFAIA
jgi:hypothetical protein